MDESSNQRMATKKELEIALKESLKLQTHYAALLNDYDGGQRRGFLNSEVWIARLKETGRIRVKNDSQIDRQN